MTAQTLGVPRRIWVLTGATLADVSLRFLSLVFGLFKIFSNYQGTKSKERALLLITRTTYLLLRHVCKNQFIANVSHRFADFKQLTNAAIIHTQKEHSLCCQ